MSEYHPPLEGRSPNKHLLLDFNEKTTDSPDIIKNSIIDYVKSNNMNTYPKYGNILNKLAKYAWVSSDNLMITNGIDQWIDIVFRACAGIWDEVIIPNPTFAMYEQSANIQNVKILKPEYTFDKWFPFNEVLSSITEKTKLIVICNPNSPTWTILTVDKILEIAKQAPNSAILVDECYFEYSWISVKDYIEKYKNLFITRTFSKTWWLPSLRIAYLMSHKDNIKQLLKIRWPYDINKLAVVAIDTALDNSSYMKQYIDEVLKVSIPMFTEFLEKNNIKYWPTSANFILLYCKDSKLLTNQLKEKWILVRPRSWPNIENTVRITMWIKKDTERVIEALTQALWII